MGIIPTNACPYKIQDKICYVKLKPAKIIVIYTAISFAFIL